MDRDFGEALKVLLWAGGLFIVIRLIMSIPSLIEMIWELIARPATRQNQDAFVQAAPNYDYLVTRPQPRQRESRSEQATFTATSTAATAAAIAEKRREDRRKQQIAWAGPDRRQGDRRRAPSLTLQPAAS